MAELNPINSNSINESRIDRHIRLAELIDEIALIDDTKYFKEFINALARAQETGGLIPMLPSFSDFSNRYHGKRDDQSPVGQMVILYDEARSKWLLTYSEEHFKRRGRYPELELSLRAPEAPLLGDVMPIVKSPEYAQRELEFNKFLNEI